MRPFTYVAAKDPSQAIATLAAHPDGRYLGGGTNLIDDMKLDVESPPHLVDVSRLPLDGIEAMPSGGVRIGATVRNSDLAHHPLIVEQYPMLSQALLSGASAQLRNMATTAGNLLQRTRCYYFRDTSCACNKRKPGSGCSALEGYHRNCAVLGTSDRCFATHPSDMCVALAALEASVHVTGPGGERVIPFEQFYVPYGDDPSRENVLMHAELITAVTLPKLPFARRSHYRKTRDRASYEFALASAAVALDIEGGAIKQSRIALGGVATKPWRSHEAETALAGQKPDEASFAKAAKAALAGAVGRKYNAFKIDLAQRTLVAALMTTAAIA